MAFAIALSDEQWEFVADLFDPPGRRGAPAVISLALDIKRPPSGISGFVPIRPLYRIEHAFAQLGRWRRLSRC